MLETALALLDPDELDLRADQVDVGGKHAKGRGAGGAQSLLDRLSAEEDVIHARIEPRLLDPQARRGVALRVEVDEEGRALGESQAGREVDRRRGLAHAALLVDDSDGLTHASVFHDPHTTNQVLVFTVLGAAATTLSLCSTNHKARRLNLFHPVHR